MVLTLIGTNKNSVRYLDDYLFPAPLFKDKVLSLGAAAKISGLCLADFIDHLAELDIDIVSGDQQTENEAETLKAWLS